MSDANRVADAGATSPVTRQADRTSSGLGGMDSPAWRKASPARRAAWLRNQIAYAKDHPNPNALSAYWLNQYRKRLARIEHKVTETRPEFLRYTVDTFKGENWIASMGSALSWDGAREIARAHAALGYTVRMIAFVPGLDYTEVYEPDGSVRRGPFAETTLVKS